MNRTASRCEAVKKTASTYTCKRSKERRRRRRRWNQIENYISKGKGERASSRSRENKSTWQLHLVSVKCCVQLSFLLYLLYIVDSMGKLGRTQKKKKRKPNKNPIFPFLYSIRSHSWLSIVCSVRKSQKTFFFISFLSSLYKSQSYRQKCWKELGSCFFSTFFDLFQFPFFPFEVKELSR